MKSWRLTVVTPPHRPFILTATPGGPGGPREPLGPGRPWRKDSRVITDRVHLRDPEQPPVPSRHSPHPASKLPDRPPFSSDTTPSIPDPGFPHPHSLQTSPPLPQNRPLLRTHSSHLGQDIHSPVLPWGQEGPARLAAPDPLSHQPPQGRQ